jgi:hypothetical protein
MYNLGEDVQDLCEELKIDIIATGGNYDFPFVSLAEEGANFTVISLDSDSGPESLEEPVTVNCCLDMDWCKFTYVQFDTAKQALFSLTKPDFIQALFFYELDVSSSKGHHYDLEQVGFSDTIASLYNPSTMSILDLCQKVIESFGGKIIADRE